MGGPIIYVDTSEVREGRLEELKVGLKELADFVEANEPRIVSYGAFFNEDETQVSIVHSHVDSESLEYHMEVGGPIFRKFVDLISLKSIQIFGEPSETVVQRLHEKARLLGAGVVRISRLHAGFARFETR